MSWSYGALATEVYDLDKPIGTSFGDVEYYKQLLGGSEGRILEPAVGTGRVMIPLLEAGFEVEGYDTSPEMLAVCREHCRDRKLDPVIREADMTSFVEPGAYSAVIVPIGSIALLDGRGALLQALACFEECLMPSGRLSIDVRAPRPFVMEPVPMRSWSAGPFIWTLQTMHIDYDPAANQTTQWLRYEKWRDGALVATELQPFRLQHWSIAEFTALLFEAGFRGVTVTGDYRDGLPPDPESDDWIFNAFRS
ncbi:MAG: class I SAM-dependent methyltransferase [Acidimicrobiales bacterium]